MKLQSIICLLIFATNLFAQTWPVPFSKDPLELSKGRIAVVLGAGPAGLIAAKNILDAGFHEQIFIIEKRDSFSRVNYLNFFPESWPILRELRIADALKKISHPAKSFRFYIQRSDAITNFESSDENTPMSFDYRGPVKDIFQNPRIGLHIFNIAQMQHELAQQLIQDKRVKLIHGEGRVLPTSDKNLMHEIRIECENDAQPLVLSPDLIVIAEGAHSINREHIGIIFEQKIAPQLWCSGSVSLLNHYSNTTMFVQLADIYKDNILQRTVGIFNLPAQQLFLNGEVHKNESVDDCLKRNGALLIKYARHAANNAEDLPKLTVNPDEIQIIRKNEDIIVINPSKAVRAVSGNNVILTGDAAGNSTPRGGIGLSLITSVYQQALRDFLNNNDRKTALVEYNRRVSEIVDYWHLKTDPITIVF